MLRADITTIPASTDRPNEDVAGRRGDAVVLMDGAGMPAALRAGCTHTVDWFSRHAVDRYLHHLQDPAAPMKAALAQTISDVAALHSDTCDLDAGSPSATVVAVRRVGRELQHLVLSDSSLGLVGHDATTVITDDSLSEVRHPLGDRLRELREGLDPTRDHAHPHLMEAWREHDLAIRNPVSLVQSSDAQGFWCVGHRSEAADHALTGRTPIEDLRGVVLASDGAMRLAEIFGELTPEALLTAYLEDGADTWLARTRAVETEHHDESVRLWRKPHDDATVAIWRRP